jgi:hypothetical protein
MKKTTMMIVATALVMALPIITLAQDNNRPAPNDASTTAETSYWNDNFSVTTGFKIWRATNSFKTVDGDDVETTSNMYGPSVNLTMFDKWYTGLSFYWGNGFDYIVEKTYENTGQDYEVDVDGEKTDLDIWVGYRFHPRASVFLGYKSSRFKQDGKTELNDITSEFSAEINYYGPVVGVNGNYPIKDSGFILFGTFGYAFLDGESKVELKASNTITGESEKASGDETDKYRGPAIEFGVSYVFKNIPQLSLSGGYKYQSYENVDNSDVDPWTFAGLTFGANYRF